MDIRFVRDLGTDLLKQSGVGQLRGELDLAFSQSRFGSKLFGDVAGDATRMDELAILPIDARADEDNANRAIAVAQANWVLAEGVALDQRLQNVRNDGGIGVEI